MKLFTHYNRVNLITTVVVLFITGVVYYQAISFILNRQVDKDIRTEEVESFNYIKQNNALPDPVDDKSQKVDYIQVPAPVTRRFLDTGFYNKKEKEYESGRCLISPLVVNGKYYQMTITESKVETEDLIRIVFLITIGLILFLLLVLFIINRFVLNKLWRPFYATLSQVRQFSLNGDKQIEAAPTNIDEFNELSIAICQMAGRVKTDYSDLKTFTENASHELLTPIAVINSKLDSLIQAGTYTEPQSKLLNDIYDAVSRMTRLNQSLLLLVKIENKLLKDEQQIDLKPFITDKVNEFKELFQDKSLICTTNLVHKQISISRYLAEILLNNLLSNAMRHNYQYGRITITLTDQALTIANTGAGEALVTSEIFKRFNKASASEGTGLGLTISRQICDNYGYRLSYNFENNNHSFTINFS